MDAPPLVIAAAARPYPGEAVSGDAWSVQWHNGACRVTVIDGLGHGPAAAQAAQAAQAILAERPELDPAAALEACHQALHGTRGAAALVALIDAAAGRLIYAGIGNIEGRLRQNGSEQRLVSYRGIVGSMFRNVHVFELPLTGEWLLLLHTDGVSARFETAALPSLSHGPQSLADAVLEGWGRFTDDATVVVVWSPGGRPLPSPSFP